MRLYRYATGEPVETLEMRVLAKAYRAAWRSVHAREPCDCHVIEAADLVIDFGQIGLAAAVRQPAPPGHDVDRYNAEDNR